MAAVKAAAEKVARQPHAGAAVAALRDAAACLAAVDRCAGAIALAAARELAGLPKVPVPRQRHLHAVPIAAIILMVVMVSAAAAHPGSHAGKRRPVPDVAAVACQARACTRA